MVTVVVVLVSGAEARPVGGQAALRPGGAAVTSQIQPEGQETRWLLNQSRDVNLSVQNADEMCTMCRMCMYHIYSFMDLSKMSLNCVFMSQGFKLVD